MQPGTIGELLYWSYANLAMAHAALSNNAEKYGRVHFMIRSRLYKGLCSGTMQPGSLVDDERLKMTLPQCCCYCGSTEALTVDHLIPQSKGGSDTGDNLVWACRSCNSAKSASDVLEWMGKKGIFPPLLLLRRYLKLAIDLASAAGAMDTPLGTPSPLPFALDAIPMNFPAPTGLQLWVVDLSAIRP